MQLRLGQVFLIHCLVCAVWSQGEDQGDRTFIYGNRLAGHTNLPQPTLASVYIDSTWRLDKGLLQNVYVFVGTLYTSSPHRLFKFQIWTRVFQSVYRLKWQTTVPFNRGGDRLYEVAIDEQVEVDENDRLGFSPSDVDTVTWTFKYDHETRYTNDSNLSIGKDVNTRLGQINPGIIYSIAARIRKYYEGDVRILRFQSTVQLQGTVMVFYKERWGTICYDDWRHAEAYVICNAHFGFQRGIAIPGSSGVSLPVLWQASCRDSSSRCLLDCSLTDINNIPGRQCRQSDAAGVRCTPYQYLPPNHISAGNCRNSSITTTTTTTGDIGSSSITVPVITVVPSQAGAHGAMSAAGIAGITIGCVCAILVATFLVFVLNFTAKKLRHRRENQRRRNMLATVHVYGAREPQNNTNNGVMLGDLGPFSLEEEDHRHRGSLPSPPSYSDATLGGRSSAPPAYEGAVLDEEKPPPYSTEPPPPYNTSPVANMRETSV